MNTKTAYLILSVVLVTILGGGFYMYSQLTGTGPAGSDNEPYQDPFGNDNYVPYGTKEPSGTGSDVVGSPISVPSSDGGSIRAIDFLKDSNVHADTVNPGQYYVGYQVDPSSDQPPNVPYIITYHSASGFFNVALMQEPLADSRAKAELYLMRQLGVNKEGMCRLKYTVGVPNRVSPIYAGLNLGWSFCPGATQL